MQLTDERPPSAPLQGGSRALSGLALGMVLSFAGFADFGEVHRMFCFADLRLTLAFGCAVTLAALGFKLLPKCEEPTCMHKGIIPGGILFGAGWALTGACPSAAFVQLGEGQLPAIVTCVGIFCGILLFRVGRRADS